MPKSFLYWALLLLLLADTGYSFLQHYRMPLDGDMAAIIWPSEGYRQVLNNPFGWRAVFQGETYPAPNRFFAHLGMTTWFRNVPLWLQGLVSPIDSIYGACALAKTGMQVFLILLLATYITGSCRLGEKRFLGAALLMAPLFQTAGYNQVMGIIDKSVTYCFFYALPLGLLMWYLFPLYRSFYLEETRRPGPILLIFLALLAIVLAFNGPLIPGVVFIVAILALWNRGRGTGQKPLLVSLALFGVLCAYSFYVGRFNAENLSHEIPMIERYLRLPEGLFWQFARKPGPVLLLIAVLLNALLIQRTTPDSEGRKILRTLGWIGLFSLLFILLLPLGGYRDYRPNIIRRDTLMPVFLCLFYFYGLSTRYLWSRLRGVAQKAYWAGVILLLCVFTLSDNFHFPNNACEREELGRIAASSETVVPLEAGCKVMSWDLPTDPASSEWNALLLEYWGVTDEKTLFYHK